MDFVKEMKAKAAAGQKKLVLPEGTDTRTLKAARIIIDEKLASAVYLLGKTADIEKAAAEAGVKLDGLLLVDPVNEKKFNDYANEFFELRKHKGMTEEQAKIDMADPLRWGAMMVRLCQADTSVAGSL